MLGALGGKKASTHDENVRIQRPALAMLYGTKKNCIKFFKILFNRMEQRQTFRSTLLVASGGKIIGVKNE